MTEEYELVAGMARKTVQSYMLASGNCLDKSGFSLNNNLRNPVWSDGAVYHCRGSLIYQ